MGSTQTLADNRTGGVVKQRRKERIDRGIKARSDDIFALTSYREMLYVSVPPVLPVIASHHPPLDPAALLAEGADLHLHFRPAWR